MGYNSLIVSQNLNPIQKMPTEWNQQLSKCLISKVIKCSEKSNIGMNTKFSKKKINYKIVECKTKEWSTKYWNESMGKQICRMFASTFLYYSGIALY